MNTFYSLHRTKYLLILAGIALALAVVLFGSSQAAYAAGCTDCAPQRGCVNDFQPDSVCTANDVTIGQLTVIDVPSPCTNPGDTATVLMQAKIVTGASERYDIGLFVALNGGSAKLESPAYSNYCYHDYLRPPLSTTPTPAGQDRYSPFFDAEPLPNPRDNNKIDTCGDTEQNINTFYDLAAIDILCVDANNDKVVDPINTCVSWDNNKDNTPVCTSEAQAYPNTKAKCSCPPPIPVNIPIKDANLAVDKIGPTSRIEEGETFIYTLRVVNLGPDVAEGAKIDADNLDENLKFESYSSDTLGVTCTPEADPGDTLGWGGEIIKCDLGDMAVNQIINVYLTVTMRSPDPNDPTDPGIPDPLENTFCARSNVDDPNMGNNCDTTTTQTPVTLAYFLASRQGDELRFDWSTSTEVGTLGYNFYVKTADGLQRLNDALVPISPGNAMRPKDYSATFKAVEGSDFYIEELDVRNQARRYGPFALDKPYGGRLTLNLIDWASIQAESGAKEQARINTRLAGIAQGQPTYSPAVQPAGSQGPLAPGAGVSLFLPVTTNGTGVDPSQPTAFADFELRVNQTGLQRITYEQLKSAGLDLTGVSISSIALLNRGLPVPVYVYSKTNTFGAGSYIEFQGEALNTLYTHTNVYILRVNQSQAMRPTTDSRTPPTGAPVSSYMETAATELSNEYNSLSPTGEPWFDEMFIAGPTSPQTENRTMAIDNLAAGGQATLSVYLYGGTTEMVTGPDNHVRITFNGSQVANQTFDELAGSLIAADVSGLVNGGDNALKLEILGDSGGPHSIVYLDRYSLAYPRGFVARDGRLSFTASGALFKVNNLPTRNIVVYRLQNGTLSRYSKLTISGSGPYSVSFAGSSSPATYFVSTTTALSTPVAVPAQLATDITSGSAQYLIISHPDFISGLDRLVSARQAQGYSVKVVDVEDVYAQFGYSIFDPQAIKNYIRYAAAAMGTQYVLLVGGDTNDYFNYLGVGSKSFIPSIYAGTGVFDNFAPSDGLYADINLDFKPDLAIGRFPVRTTAELDMLIDKTLAYQNKDYGQTGVFAADFNDGLVDFVGDSNAFIAKLPTGWTVQKAYLDEEVDVDAARAILIDSMNAGVALASFVGHSGPWDWTYEGLFNAYDAAGLTNNGRPMIVTQWGCWNTYYVDPYYDTLSHEFLLNGNQGAAAVLGTTTITSASSDSLLGKQIMPYLTQPGMTIGAAMRQAKQELALGNAHRKDVLFGWTILGDPTLVIQP